MRPTVPEHEVEFSAVRARGPGGQNVHKVCSAVHLRFDVRASSLPEDVKLRLLALEDRRLTTEGVLVIKAESSRSYAQNKADAMARLMELVEQAAHTPTPRKPTKPTFGSRQRRLRAKSLRSDVKASRGKERL